MSKEQVRIKTKQPGVYQNQQTGKYDVKYNYTEYDPTRGEKRYRAKWVYGINSYQTAVNTLAKMKAKKTEVNREEITLLGALELWENKAIANDYTKISIRNTKQQFNMITQFWVPETKLRFITEESYLELISKCREYGYSEETVYNINACLRKLIKLAYRNRYLQENPLSYFDNAKICPKTVREVISYEEYLKLDEYFASNAFYRSGQDCYPKYRLLLRILYWTGMRIGEALALIYDDFELYSDGRMNVSITKSYNSAYRLLKGTKNDKTRKIPLPEQVTGLFALQMQAHLQSGGGKEEKLFEWAHGSCITMIRKACREVGIREYSCHSFRHTYISNLIRQCVPIAVIEQVSGDTQETILTRYSHMFKGDEGLVLEALKKVESSK